VGIGSESGDMGYEVVEKRQRRSIRRGVDEEREERRGVQRELSRKDDVGSGKAKAE